jgi:putative ABC transport system permease protein
MLKQIFLGLYRDFKKGSSYRILNIFNLISGFTAFILLSIVVNHELTYDTFNTNYNRIFRVQTKQEDSYPINYCIYSPATYRFHLMPQIPEVEAALLIKEIQGSHFTLPNGNEIYENNGYWSENSIFDIFSIRIIEGTKATALIDPFTISISRKFAEKIFPGQNAMGKKLILDKKYPLVVTCVYEDIPENSVLDASYMVSATTYEALRIRENFQDDWYHIDWYNYVLLKKNVPAELVDDKLKDAFSDIRNMEKSKPYLLSLSKLHLSPTNKSDKVLAITLLSLAAMLILAVSFLNYVNLSLVYSRKKAHSTGIKKVLGFSRQEMIIQSVYETVTVTIISLVAGLYFSQLLLPVLSSIMQKEIDVNLFNEWRLLLIVGLTGLIAGVVSGIYPALILSSYTPGKTMKIESIQGKYPGMKKVLVVIQFSVTLFMITVSLIIHSHVKFIEDKSLGFNSNDLLFSEVDFKNPVSLNLIKSKLKSHPEIIRVSFSFSIPFNGNGGGYISWDGASPEQMAMISRNIVDCDFTDTYGIEMFRGRFFSKEFSSDEKACVINESALKTFGWQDYSGRYISYNDQRYPVVGIVKDFHPFAVTKDIPNYVMFLQQETLVGTSLMSVKYVKGKEADARKIVKSEMDALFPELPLYLRDFDELLVMNKGILSWKSVEKVFIFFSVLAVLIAVLGITGLLIFSTRRRIKEIGIRKVLGADTSVIYKLLAADIMKSLTVSVFFAFPLAFIIYRMLPGGYKEPLSLWCFISSFLIVTLVTVITTMVIISGVIRRNPVEALRYE